MAERVGGAGEGQPAVVEAAEGGAGDTVLAGADAEGDQEGAAEERNSITVRGRGTRD